MYEKYQKWFAAAAVYNLLWGLLVIIFPKEYFVILQMEIPQYLVLWQVIGMFVLVFAPAYWWAAKYPKQHPQLIAIGLLGKIFGPIGFAYSLITGILPIQFGVVILTNDLIWWPSFGKYIAEVINDSGFEPFLSGDFNS